MQLIKNLNFLFFLLVSTWANTSIAAQSTKPVQTTISGLIANANDSEVTMHFVTDVVTGGFETILVPVNINNAFSVDFNITTLIECRLSYNDFKTTFFVKPGDNLILKLDISNQMLPIQFFGDGANDTEALLYFRKKIKNQSGEFKSANLFEYKDNILNLESQLLRELKQWQKPLSNFVLKLIKLDIQLATQGLLLKAGENKAFQYTKEQLLDEFYPFLKHKIQKSENVLLSPFYKSYIEYLLVFKEKYPKFKFEDQVKKKFIVKSTSKYLYYAPGKDSTLFRLNYDDILSYNGVEFKNESSSNYNRKANLENYKWYEVSINGVTGWVSATDILSLSGASQVDLTKRPKMVKRVIQEGKVIYDNIDLIEKPTESKVVKRLYKGQLLSFLNVKTNEKYKYTLNGVTYEAYFYKLKTADGIEGWLPDMAYTLIERELGMNVSLKQMKSIDSLQNYLEGIDLYYTSARALISNYKNESKEAIRSEINNFYAINDCKLLKNAIISNIPTSYINSLKDNESSPLQVFEPVISNKHILSSTTSLTYDLFTNIQDEVKVINQLYSFFSSGNNKQQLTNKLLASYIEEIEFDIIKLKGKKYNQKKIFSQDGMVSMAIDFQELPLTGLKTVLEIDNAKTIENLFIASDIFGYSTIHYKMSKLNTHHQVIELKLEQPQVIKYYIGGNLFHLFIEPGDIIKMDALPNTIFNAANDNNETIKDVYTVFSEVTNSKDDFFSIKTTYTNAVVEMKQILFSHTVSQNFIDFALGNLEYLFANKLLAFEDKSVDCIQSIDNININNIGLSYLPSYQIFLVDYINFKSKDIENVDALSFAEGFLSQDVFNFYKAMDLFSRAVEKSISFDKTKILDFLSEEDNRIYERVLKYAYNDFSGLPYGSKAPDFHLYDISGNRVSLGDYIGKVVYIDFWATWCPPCTASIQGMQAEILAHPDVVFLFVNLDSYENSYQSYVFSRKWEGTFVYNKPISNGSSALSEIYGAVGLPKSYIINKDGYIVYNSSYSNDVKIIDVIQSIK